MRPANLLDMLEVLSQQSPEQLQGVNWSAIAVDLGMTEAELREEFRKFKEEAGKVSQEEPELETIEDPFPEFPVLFGPIHDLATLVGPSLAYSHKVLHLLTCIGLHLSGKVSLATDPWLQPRFYSVMIGPPSSTKSAVEKEMRGILFPKGTEMAGRLTYPRAPLSTEIAVHYSINSGPALVQLFEETRKIMIAPDEISSMFEKGRSTTASPNSLFGELLRLYESNETGRAVVRSGKRDKGTGKRQNAGDQIKIDNAHLALIGGATDKSFQLMWQGTSGAASGLQSRFVLTYSDQMLPPFQTLTDVGRAAEVLHELVVVLADAADKLTVTDEAQTRVLEWVQAQGSTLPPRALDMAKRAAIVLASCDHTNQVTEAVMRWCLRFADYQVAIKARLMPEDADSNIQAFENRILAFLSRQKEAAGRQIMTGINPRRFPGGYFAFEKAMTSLTRTGAIRSIGKTRKGKPIYRAD